jgi:histidinol dehydrogenase
MKKYYGSAPTTRPAIKFDPIVKTILEDVGKNGDKAVKKYSDKFDGQLTCSTKLTPEIKDAFKIAAKNIEAFHKAQITTGKKIETMPGVTCFQEARPIEKVGLYIPGGTAPLPSTLLMLAIPARLAGCKEIVMCSPCLPEIMQYVAKLAGVTKIFKIGGAQAIAAMAYGTEAIPKVDKIFGPGNQYVTAAKMLCGTAIDMPAGPSEVLVIADKYARADFVAADLLSQAEHGPDSQVVLVCTDEDKADEILEETTAQLEMLPRKDIAKAALENSFALIVADIVEAVKFSNKYAPEHLILNVKKADQYLDQVINAGSVFIGQYSCESAGDYASGTNHTLPTYGYAKSYSGVSVDSFMKKITFQKLNKEGIKNIGPVVEKMAEIEQLQAHKNAMTLRIKSLPQKND